MKKQKAIEIRAYQKKNRVCFTLKPVKFEYVKDLVREVTLINGKLFITNEQTVGMREYYYLISAVPIEAVAEAICWIGELWESEGYKFKF